MIRLVSIFAIALLLTACAPRQPQPRGLLTPDAANVAAFAAAKAVSGDYAHMNGASMEPALQQGDLVLYRAAPFLSVREGQVIIFRRGPDYVAHRAIRLTADGWITKGDSNRHADAWTVTHDNFVGIALGVIWQ
jgi:signal peptidase I